MIVDSCHFFALEQDLSINSKINARIRIITPMREIISTRELARAHWYLEIFDC